MINAVLDIKLLAPEEWHLLRNARLRALCDSPRAFVSRYDAEAHWTEAQWRHRLTAGRWVVAVESGIVIGIAGLVDGHPLDGWHVEWSWVAPTHRHLGVFRTLLRVLLDRRREEGAREVSLWVLEDNQDALHVYLRIGFVPTGERQRLHGDDRFELRLRIEIADGLSS